MLVKSTSDIFLGQTHTDSTEIILIVYLLKSIGDYIYTVIHTSNKNE